MSDCAFYTKTGRCICNVCESLAFTGKGGSGIILLVTPQYII